jgi:hypothetical protein
MLIYVDSSNLEVDTEKIDCPRVYPIAQHLLAIGAFALVDC